MAICELYLHLHYTMYIRNGSFRKPYAFLHKNISYTHIHTQHTNLKAPCISTHKLFLHTHTHTHTSLNLLTHSDEKRYAEEAERPPRVQKFANTQTILTHTHTHTHIYIHTDTDTRLNLLTHADKKRDAEEAERPPRVQKFAGNNLQVCMWKLMCVCMYLSGIEICGRCTACFFWIKLMYACTYVSN
jgi:hypothetical protein